VRDPQRGAKLRRRVFGAVLLVSGVAWVALVVATGWSNDSGFLHHPYSRYVTTVTLIENQGSGCGTRAEIWRSRDPEGRQVRVCDERLGNGDEGEILDVGQPTLGSRLDTFFVVVMILSLPGALAAVWGYPLAVGR
jgi:hypothetical protein